MGGSESVEDAKLWVITTYFNPSNYKSKKENCLRFIREMAQYKQVQLVVVECAFDDQAFSVTDPKNPWHTRIRTASPIWLKESLINIAITRLPQEAEYIAWLDADITFMYSQWPKLVIRALQTHKIVQVFRNCINLLPDDATVERSYRGFGYCNVVKRQAPLLQFEGDFPHPGYGWAINKLTLLEMGGLFSRAIAGGGDKLMANAFIGKFNEGFPVGVMVSGAFQAYYNVWAQNAYKLVQGSVGFADVDICHHYHGSKKDRDYAGRWKLIESLNPQSDLVYLEGGLIGISPHVPNKREIEAGFRAYFEGREEDDIPPPTAKLAAVALEYCQKEFLRIRDAEQPKKPEAKTPTKQPNTGSVSPQYTQSPNTKSKPKPKAAETYLPKQKVAKAAPVVATTTYYSTYDYGKY